MLDILIKKIAQEGSAICRLPSSEKKPIFALFSNPIFKEEIYALSDIKKAFERIEQFKKNGNAIVMCVSYECAVAFDPIFEFKKSQFPLLSYMVYAQYPEIIPPFSTDEETEPLKFKSKIDFPIYESYIKRLFQHLFEGNIYQANFTFQSHSLPLKTPERDFLIRFTQKLPPHAAFVHLKKYKILSFSPELFLFFDGKSHLVSKPMKGTVKRGLSVQADLQAIDFLKNDLKNQAENLMIVDMVRNDFSRIEKVSEVRVDPLFEVETYPTTHQLVSTVYAKIPLQTSLFSLFKALFPAASITGAPKINAINLLNAFEKTPRGIYTGSIGCVMPDGSFSFNVAIRTLCCTQKQTTLGVGGGILYESTPESEWEEALLKQQFAYYALPFFEVFETMFWSPKQGFAFLEEHLQRAQQSQHYFLRDFQLEKARQALDVTVQNLKESHIVKITFKPDGLFQINIEKPRSFTWKTIPLKIVISKTKTNSTDHFLYHKTTHRPLYTQAFEKIKKEGFDEVIFFNERDELTEGSISNIFLKINEVWHTPKINCGLLEGIARNHYIRVLNATTSILNQQMLFQAEKVLLVNSVRGVGIVESIQD